MFRAFLRKFKRFLLRHAGIVALTESQATARAEVSNVTSALAEVKGLLAAMKAGFAELHVPLGEGQASLDKVKTSLGEAHSALRETKASLRETKASLRETKTSLGEMKATLDPVQAALGAIRGAVAEMKPVLGGLRHAQAEQAAAAGQALAEIKVSLAELTSGLGGLRHAQAAAAQQALEDEVRPLLGEHSELLRHLLEQTTNLSAGQYRLVEEQGQNRLAIDYRLAGMNSQLVHIDAFYRILSQLNAGLNRATGSNTDLGVDKWKFQEYEGLLRYFRKKEYLQAIDSGRLPIPRLDTNHPTAAESNDTRFPRGAKNDNSICLRFNRKLYALLGDKPQIKVLDLGCAGGGFVRSLLDDGHFAVGLDGCPYPKLNQVGEWATIPQHLHTCDVTQLFTICADATGQPIQFDAITAWELMEHIPEESLPTLLANIDRHLAPGGSLLCSIATFVDRDEATGVVWHVTVKAREWWVARFAEAGFLVEEQSVLDKNDWLRGSGNCRGDWHEDDDLGFHLVLRRREAVALAAA